MNTQEYNEVIKKQSKEIRKFYSNLIENNQDNIQIWFDAVAKNDPAKALE